MNLGVSPDRQQLIDAVKAHYIASSISVMLHKRSDKRRVIFKCYHGNEYRNPLHLTNESRRRNSASCLLRCPFKVVAKLHVAGWTVITADETHNHELPSNIGRYSTVRKLAADEKAAVRTLFFCARLFRTCAFTDVFFCP
ncbi:hypothetical protein BJ741DRAFT_637641 [Chytriomyces cf. hyalinus JEL632]|nr:hypothetical protein BJ741DRAFT_637641 [Chytriomyces cf. hyalinus JEL632]